MSLPTLNMTCGLAYQAEARRRLAEARSNLRHADDVLERFGPHPLARNWRDLCEQRLRDALAICAEMGVDPR